MATNNPKCFALITAVAVFVTITQANATLKANTVTSVTNAVSNKLETKLQNNTHLKHSDTKQFNEPKISYGRPNPIIPKFNQSKHYTKKFRQPGLDKYKKFNFNASKKTQKNINPNNETLTKVSFRHKRAIKKYLLGKKSVKLLKNKHDTRKKRPHLRKSYKENPDIIQTNPEGCQAAFKEDVEKFITKSKSLTGKYKTAIDSFVEEVGGDKFDKEMYDVMLANRSVSERALHSAGGVVGAVPAGLQLGGYGILKEANTLLFFHRMKLRNKTDFLLGPVKSNWYKMTLETYLVLGDLHLTGNFERLKIDKMIPSKLHYAPTYGSANILLRDVHYKLEGRYRVSGGRLIIEQIISNITSNKPGIIVFDDDVPALNVKVPSPMIEFEQLADFVDRMKIDLNEWVKDYFNDYLTYFGLASERVNAEFQRYDKRKGLEFDGYIDHILKVLRRRIELLQPNENDARKLFNLQDFTIFTVNGMTLKLTNGRVEGLNTIYRRGPGTGWRETIESYIMMLDAVVAFSDLKVVYKYEATTPAEGTPMQGHLILTANELAAHMAVRIIGTYYITFDEIYPIKVQTLTIEGPVNRMIGNFKHVLENQITALLTNVLIKKVKDLKTSSYVLCKVFNNDAGPLPRLQGFDDYENKQNPDIPTKAIHSEPTTPVVVVPDDHDRTTEHPDENFDGLDVNSKADSDRPGEDSHGEPTKPIEDVSDGHGKPTIPTNDNPITPDGNPNDIIDDSHGEITERSPHDEDGLRKFVGRQKIAKKGGTNSKSQLLVFD